MRLVGRIPLSELSDVADVAIFLCVLCAPFVVSAVKKKNTIEVFSFNPSFEFRSGCKLFEVNRFKCVHK